MAILRIGAAGAVRLRPGTESIDGRTLVVAQRAAREDRMRARELPAKALERTGRTRPPDAEGMPPQGRDGHSTGAASCLHQRAGPAWLSSMGFSEWDSYQFDRQVVGERWQRPDAQDHLRDCRAEPFMSGAAPTRAGRPRRPR
ncbi:hypothetical protein [Siccirubricoccus sp. G192]|uniref:hypothetical protein n=1 Tax=Siccirubricoccus sp. G192 TaxID=2849651 RepID=UPI001C2C339C|nr:hypothetical protein [Siccirubricoccus sp. G192]MBV1797610.1 hypothetical protein [Siccirubricoccus sp. G192]